MAAPNPRLAQLSNDDRHVLESWLIEFDQRWDPGLLPSRVEQIPPGSSWRLPALAEMVKIDLERQWQRGRQVSLESYLEEFPELGSPGDVSADLIEAECEVRRQFGAPVRLEDYLCRFPHQTGVLARLFGEARAARSRRSSVAAATVTFTPVEKTGAAPGPLAPTVSYTPVEKTGAAPTPLPEQFGRYRIIKRLGQGGMGSVYLAEDTQLKRLVALKVPEFGRQEGAEVRRRFLEEARTAATLDHPYLCPVFDIGEIEGRLYLTMAFIEGSSLAELTRGKSFTSRQVAALVGKLALAMQEAHKKKVIHRDLKPANVMVKTTGEQREPVIVDFGLAHRDDPGEERLTITGQVMGTLAYMAPEQIRGDLNEIGPACDIYALGVILYELLTGAPPFRGKGLAIASDILNVPPPPPSTRRSDLEPALDAICLKAMAKQVGDRYASMGEMAAALTGFLRSSSATQLPASPAGSLASSSPASPKPRRATGSDTLLAEFFGPLVAEKTFAPSIAAPEPAASPSPLPERRRPRWPLIVAAAVLGVLLLGIIVSVATDKGRIRMVVNNPQAVVSEPIRDFKATASREPAKAPEPAPVPAVVVDSTVPQEAIPSPEPAQAPEPAPTATAAADATVPLKEAIPSREPEKAIEPAPVPAVVADLTVPAKEITKSSSKKSVAGRRTARGGHPPTRITNTMGMTLMLIPSGSFAMGSPDSDQDALAAEKPRHTVRIARPFYLGVTEVTQGQYRVVTGQDPSSFTGSDNLPVECVSWLDAVNYCNALSLGERLPRFYRIEGEKVEVPDWTGPGYRLPTEAEWEYACRAGSTTRYYYGDDRERLGEYAWYYMGNSVSRTHPVGGKRPNAFGLYDMYGNVREWCWDSFDAMYYGQSPAADPHGPAQPADRVTRGGSFQSIQVPQRYRSASRMSYPPAFHSSSGGFRVARGQSGR